MKFVRKYLRKRRDTNTAYKNMWAKKLPFKISDFMWKLWRAKLLLDYAIRRMGYIMPSRCWFFVNPQEENMAHVFFISYAASRVWSCFFSFSGLSL